MWTMLVGGGDAVASFANLQFSVEPADIVAVRGQPALLNCSIRPDLPTEQPQIQWLRDSVALNFDTNDRW